MKKLITLILSLIAFNGCNLEPNYDRDTTKVIAKSMWYRGYYAACQDQLNHTIPTSESLNKEWILDSLDLFHNVIKDK